MGSRRGPIDGTGTRGLGLHPAAGVHTDSPEPGDPAWIACLTACGHSAYNLR